MSNGIVSTDGKNLILRIDYDDLALIKARAIPQRRWLKGKKAWQCRPSLANIEYIRAAFPYVQWDPAAEKLAHAAAQRKKLRDEVLEAKAGGRLDLSVLDNVPFALPPFDHQKKALLLGRDMPYFAYLMDQGTGKTKVTLDDAAHNFREDRIDALLVIAPNSVKTNWVNANDDGSDAVSQHLAPDIDPLKQHWISQPRVKEKRRWQKFERALTEYKRDKLIIISINVEALALKRCEQWLTNFVTAFRTMIVVDESTRIKTPSAKRTQVAHRLRKLCPVARILSGTPIIQSPLDAYAQFTFLDEDVLGYTSFYSFRNRYAVMGGFENRQVLYFINLEELSDRIASCSYRVTKDECLDLPPKLYDKRSVYMTGVQAKAYESMKEEFMYSDGETTINAPIVLTQLLRLQEITSGFLPIINEEGERIGTKPLIAPADNPKFQEFMGIVEESGSQKIIVWCRFTAEIEALSALLTARDVKHVLFYGKVSDEDRVVARQSFQNDPEVKVFVGNPAAGGIGLDLFAASIVCYMSNSFDTEHRVQSEDRAHRIGSERHNTVNYYDIICPHTVDVKIVSTLRGNKRIADEVMQDGLREWI